MNYKKLIQEEINNLNKLINKIYFENLNYLGSGDFGKAYSIGNDTVLKLTRSKREYEIAKELENTESNLYKDCFAIVYETGVYKNDYYIILEELELDSNIENLYYELDDLLNSQNLPIQYIEYLEYNEEEIGDDLISFINQISNINRGYRSLGILASDIKPDNLGYDKNGNLKAFDIDDKDK